MSTKQFQVLTSAVKQFTDVNNRRQLLMIKNMSGIDGKTGRLCRISDVRDVGSGEGYILDDNEIIIMQRVDRDRPDKAWFARMVDGPGTICIIEEYR